MLSSGTQTEKIKTNCERHKPEYDMETNTMGMLAFDLQLCGYQTDGQMPCFSDPCLLTFAKHEETFTVKQIKCLSDLCPYDAS